MPPVTLEITMAPADLPVVRHTVPHQLRQLGSQVAEIQFTLDPGKRPGRSGAAADERRSAIEALLGDLCDRHAHARTAVVDYDADVNRAVGKRFFGGRRVPVKNHYGGPIYSYFYGWHAASNDLVFHLDCDMLLGGGSETWVAEAVELLRSRDDTVLVSPFPGPPSDAGLSQDALGRHTGTAPRPPRRLSDEFTYAFPKASTRLILFDRAKLVDSLGALPLARPRARSVARALLEGHSPYDLAEEMITRRMEERDLWRVDLLGSAPGMWSLHPAMRSDEFLAALPELVRRVEEGDIPDEQVGDFNVNDSMVDWTSARRAQRQQTWPRRLARRWLRLG